MDLPFSVYLGLITVATVANVTDLPYLIGWNGFGIAAPTWAVIRVLVASVLGLRMALTRRDAGYLFVLVWSFVGIALKQVAAPNVVIAAWMGAGFTLVLAVYGLRPKTT